MVRRVAEAALTSHLRPIIVVVGHQAAAVMGALAGLDVTIVNNPDYQLGKSTSLRVGIDSLPPDAEGIVILLGDMPFVEAKSIDRLVAALDPGAGVEIVVAVNNGQRGNPVAWSARWFGPLKAAHGDEGGRALIEANRAVVAEVEIGAAASRDIDTPDDLAAARTGLSAR
jgi:molybdenum cofactor cytidylyltransferase